MRFLWLALLLMGCARPNYVSPGSGAEPNEKANGNACAAYFNSGSCVAWEWEVRGTTKSFSTILLKTGRANKADGTVLPEDLGLTLDVVPLMPEMGHGTSPVRVQQLDTGTYRVDKISLMMVGTWDLHVQLKEADVVKDEAIIRIPF